MEIEPGGTSISVICGTPQEMAEEENPIVDVSPIMWMQNLKETPQIAIVIKNKNVKLECLWEKRWEMCNVP